ncbi:MAG: hypothetical protein AAF236_07385, partial [Verrucomicrobiota bacterium]
MKGFFGFIWLLFFSAGLTANPFSLSVRIDEGTVSLSFEIAPLEATNQEHGGWDFFDGEEKQFWLGSG